MATKYCTVEAKDLVDGQILLHTLGPLEIHGILEHPSGERLFIEVSHLDGSHEPDLMVKPNDKLKVAI